MIKTYTDIGFPYLIPLSSLKGSPEIPPAAQRNLWSNLSISQKNQVQENISE